MGTQGEAGRLTTQFQCSEYGVRRTVRTEMFVIQWKTKVDARCGQGTKLFPREEAERLVEELNREYPHIQHEVLGVAPGPESETEPKALAVEAANAA
jgi:hypothetical protein